VNIIDNKFILIIIFSVVFSTWGFVGDILLLSQVLLLAAFYLYLLSITDLFSLTYSINKFLCYCLLCLVFISYITISAINSSFNWNISSGSFQQLEHIRFLPSTVSSDVTITKLPFLFLMVGCILPITYHFVRDEMLEFLKVVVVVNAIILCIVGLFVKFVGVDKMLGFIIPPEGTERYFFSTFTYKNHWSIYLILCFCCALSLLRDNVHYSYRYVRFIVLIAILIFPVSIILSGSRSCSLIIAVLLFPAVYSYFDYINNLLRLALSLILPLIVLVIGLFSIQENYNEIVNTTKIYYDSLVDKNSSTRILLIRDTWKMFLESPIFGWGLGSFELVFNYYEGGVFRGSDHDESHYYVYAHNDVLQMLSELGIFGFSLLILIYLYPIYQLNQFCMRNKWITVGLIIVLLYSFVEFPFRTPAVALLFCVLYGSNFKVRP
jgi:O-antigen ligase